MAGIQFITLCVITSLIKVRGGEFQYPSLRVIEEKNKEKLNIQPARG